MLSELTLYWPVANCIKAILSFDENSVIAAQKFFLNFSILYLSFFNSCGKRIFVIDFIALTENSAGEQALKDMISGLQIASLCLPMTSSIPLYITSSCFLSNSL